jgi:hypothetical protein
MSPIPFLGDDFHLFLKKVLLKTINVVVIYFIGFGFYCGCGSSMTELGTVKGDCLLLASVFLGCLTMKANFACGGILPSGM